MLNWEQRIDPAISAGVHAYAVAIGAHPAVFECVPAYASLLVRFAPPRISETMLRDYIHELTPGEVDGPERQRHLLPVCYDGADLTAVSGELSLDPEALIALHAGHDYQVYQLGFRPGFAFLGDTPPALEIARHASPRARVPAGSVGLAGRQTGVYPTASPGGWQLIGRCPLPLLRSGTNPTLLRAGDHVRFHPITPAEFLHLQNHPPPWPER